jgi:hypothetical protein
MENILDREFIAVDFAGKELRITDVTQVIKVLGVPRFLGKFGLTFGKIRFETYYYHYEFSGVMPYYIAKTEFEFILTDGLGRKYSPHYLVSVLEKQKPKLMAKLSKCTYEYRYARWRRGAGFSGQRRPKRSAKIKRSKFNKQSWQADITLREEGVKPIRNIKKYYTCPYDDDWYREPERSWKGFRKRQYKSI